MCGERREVPRSSSPSDQPRSSRMMPGSDDESSQADLRTAIGLEPRGLTSIGLSREDGRGCTGISTALKYEIPKEGVQQDTDSGRLR